MEEDFMMTPVGVLAVEHLFIGRMINLMQGRGENRIWSSWTEP